LSNGSGREVSRPNHRPFQRRAQRTGAAGGCPSGASLASVHPVMSFATRFRFRCKECPLAWKRRPQPPHSERDRSPGGGRPIAVEAGSKALLPRGRRVVVAAAGQPSAAAHEAAILAGFTPRQARRLIEPSSGPPLDNSSPRSRKELQRTDRRGTCRQLICIFRPLSPILCWRAYTARWRCMLSRRYPLPAGKICAVAAAKMMRNYSRSA